MSVIKIVVFDMDGVLCRLPDRALAGPARFVSGQLLLAIHTAIWCSGCEDEAG
jgi:hypothetical protein